jgi:endo-1,4-beta-xylanase
MHRKTFIGSTAAALALGPLAFQTRATAASTTLKAAAAAKGIIYGANTETEDDIDADSAYAKLIVDQCADVIAGIPFLQNQIQHGPNSYDFARADRYRDWAQSNHLLLSECHLVWPRFVAPWLRRILTPQNARDLLTSHVKTVAGRYAGQMYSWVVVNEALNPKDGRPDGLRSSPWVDTIGPEYIDMAFQAAHEADPHAILLYNDYGVENDNHATAEKRPLMLSMLEGMLKRNVPVHALGIQAHLDGNTRGFNAPGLAKFIHDVASLGLKVFITELDVDDRQIEGDFATRDVSVAKMYGTFLDTALSEKAVTTVVTWGLADKHSWRKGPRHARSDGSAQHSFPFGFNLEPTKTFDAMIAAFNAAPKR